MSIQLQQTLDGSDTLYSEQFKETYHSVNGALNETQHVFINAGLEFITKSKKEINILEIGFGSGLNALATLAYINQHKDIHVNYTTIEAYPITTEQSQQLNYSELFNQQLNTDDFIQLHQLPFNEKHTINTNFIFEKKNIKLENISNNKIEDIDLIYFDAFSPTTQPELWTTEIFTHLYSLMRNTSVLVTYCAKGQVKRNLKEAGFIVEGIPGPTGKREMTRAVKV